MTPTRPHAVRPPLPEWAAPDDFTAIADLNLRAYAEFCDRLPEGGWELMRKNLCNIEERSAAARFLVHRNAGGIVASAAYCPAGKGDPALFARDMASIQLLAVHPEHRGRGLAKALTMACISAAERDHAQFVGLFTSELMASAQQLYRSLGFQLESELPRRHGLRFFRYVLTLN